MCLCIDSANKGAGHENDRICQDAGCMLVTKQYCASLAADKIEANACWRARAGAPANIHCCPCWRRVRLEHGVEQEYREMLQHHCRAERMQQQRYQYYGYTAKAQVGGWGVSRRAASQAVVGS